MRSSSSFMMRSASSRARPSESRPRRRGRGDARARAIAELLEVVGDDVVAAGGERGGLAARYQAEHAARRDAEGDRGMSRVSSTTRHRVVDERVLDAHPRRGSCMAPTAARSTTARVARRDRRRCARVSSGARRRAADSRCEIARGSDPSATRAADTCRSARRVLRRDHHERPRARASACRSRRWPSLIASSSDDCVRGVVRLISSARTTLAKIGPRLSSNALPVSWS